MNTDEQQNEPTKMTKLQRYRFLLFIGSVIVASGVLVAVGMSLYNSSGAAQIDLSRPGYQSVRSEASRDTGNDDAFPSSGDLNDAAFDQFDAMYKTHSSRVTGTSSFEAEALSDDSLQLYVNQGSVGN
ncbi:MAG: hypothetical protein ABI397_00420 [Candidatus Saccharimonas sp.]